MTKDERILKSTNARTKRRKIKDIITAKRDRFYAKMRKLRKSG